MNLRNALSCAFLSLIFIATGCGSGDSDTAHTQPRQEPTSLKRDVTITVTANYLLYLPKDYTDYGRKSPLMLFLHGAGERGSNLELIKKHGPPKLIEQGKEFPAIVVAPQCPADQRWYERWNRKMLETLLDDIVENYNVDTDRIYLTGMSMGGLATWRLAADHPGRFAAIVPICGGGSADWGPRLAHLPVWTFHGQRDRTIPIRRSEEMVMALRQYGSDIRFTVYPEAGHDSWTQAYDTEELYTWLFKQKRRPIPYTLPKPVIPHQDPITLQIEDLQLTDATVVDVPGTNARGVQFDQFSSEATIELQLKPCGYEIDLYQYVPDKDHDSVKLRLSTETWNSGIIRLSHNDYGKLNKADGRNRVLIRDDATYNFRLYTAKPGVIVDRIVIKPLY